MKKFLSLVALLIAGSASADIARVKDSVGFEIARVYEIQIINDEWDVTGLALGEVAGLGGAFRFRMRESDNDLQHHHRIWFTSPNCSVATDFYFEIDANVSFTDPFDAEARAAMYRARQWQLHHSPPSFAVTTQSYHDPFGPCVNQTQVLPPPLNVYRRNVQVVRTYAPPWRVD